MNDYTETYTDPALIAFLLIIAGITLFFSLIFYIISSIFLAKIFNKMGEKAWPAWVPVYNSWIFLEYGGFKGALSLLTLAPIVLYPFGAIPILGFLFALLSQATSIALFVLLIIASINIGKGFGKDPVWAFLYALVTPVWLGILAFGKSTYDASLNPKSLRNPQNLQAAYAEAKTYQQQYAQPEYAPPPAPSVQTNTYPEPLPSQEENNTPEGNVEDGKK